LIELNPSCPNKVGKPIMAYDVDALKEMLTSVEGVLSKPFGIKLPAYFDFNQYQEIANVINDSKAKYISTINSIANGLVIDADTEKTLIHPKEGFGGIGGPIVKPIALANVRKMRELLREDIEVIGVGGISTGRDVFEFILAGAQAVQLGTIFMREGGACFERINNELIEFMDKKGYEKLEDFRGKLKTA